MATVAESMTCFRRRREELCNYIRQQLVDLDKRGPVRRGRLHHVRWPFCRFHTRSRLRARSGQLTLCQSAQPDTSNALSVDAIVTVAGPAVLPLVMIASKLPSVLDSLAQ